MFCSVTTGCLRGIRSYLLRVEVDVSQGLPCLSMVGLLNSEVREAGERVRVALRNSGFRLPPLHITINFAPADIRKEGTAYDLPVAVGILACLGVLPPESLEGTLFVGELGLDGEVKPVRGVLPIVHAAGEQGVGRCLVPAANAKEGGIISGVRTFGVGSLAQVIRCLQSPASELTPVRVDPELLFRRRNDDAACDFADIRGQDTVRRAAEIAAAGFHHLLLIGPPGSGKTMIARRMPGILPPLTLEESLEVSSVYSVAGLLNEKEPLLTARPFLNPHHTVTGQAMAGGGSHPRPGLVSLAHRGILFLDELPEFPRNTLDILRQPMEERRIHISRSSGTISYPADFLLLGAMNPCPCGCYPDRNKCRCKPNEIRRYLNHVSGPVLDRMDIYMETPRMELKELAQNRPGESSARIRERVMAARDRQQARYRETGRRFNSELTVSEIGSYCSLGSAEQRVMEQIFKSMELSARAYHRVLRLARTIADLDGCDRIRKKHLTEAAFYRLAGEKYWKRNPEEGEDKDE